MSRFVKVAPVDRDAEARKLERAAKMKLRHRNAARIWFEDEPPGWWAALRPGLQFEGCHSIHSEILYPYETRNIQDAKQQLKDLLDLAEPCDCDDCTPRLHRNPLRPGARPDRRPQGTVLSRSVISEILDELNIPYRWQPEACELPDDWWLRAGSGIGGHGKEWFLWHRDGRYTHPSVRTRRELRALLRKYFK